MRSQLAGFYAQAQVRRMFAVDEATAAAIRRVYEESGELSAVVEFRRHFPLIADNARARECVRMIASWASSEPDKHV